MPPTLLHLPPPLIPLLALLILLPGCSLPPQAPAKADFSGPVTRACTGDWDDLPAALRAAAARNQMAIRTQSLGTDQARFELLTIHDERADLTARRLGHSPSTPGHALQLAAFIHPFGDEARARRLLDDLALRLAQLEGVDAAPLPRGW